MMATQAIKEFEGLSAKGTEANNIFIFFKVGILEIGNKLESLLDHMFVEGG